MISHQDFANWHKARASDANQGSCVEVGEAPGVRGIRDSTLGETSPVAVVSDGTFEMLLDELRQGRLHG